MNPKDIEKLAEFRSAMINALPNDVLESPYEFEDLKVMIEVISSTNELINHLSTPITSKDTFNAVMYDPDEVSFTAKDQQPQVAQTFSKEDVLRGFDRTRGIDVNQQLNSKTDFIQGGEELGQQPTTRNDLVQPFPPTPQNSSYGTDLRNMAQYQQQQTNSITPEVLPTPWDNNADNANHQFHQSLSMMPPEIQMMLANAARYGNLQLVLAEMGMPYQQQ